MQLVDEVVRTNQLFLLIESQVCDVVIRLVSKHLLVVFCCCGNTRCLKHFPVAVEFCSQCVTRGEDICSVGLLDCVIDSFVDIRSRFDRTRTGLRVICVVLCVCTIRSWLLYLCILVSTELAHSE